MATQIPPPAPASGLAAPESEPDRHPAPNALLARNWGLVLLRGIVALVFGVLTFFVPLATIASLVLLFAAYMLVDGVLAIASGVRAARRHERWGWFVLEGVVDLAAAAAAVFLPGVTVFAFIALTAAWALVSGATMLIAAIRLGKRQGRLWLALAGAVSVLWGVLLLVAPATGAIVIAWWLAAYASAFGIAMIVVAWQLRRRRSDAGPAGAGDWPSGGPRPA